MLGQPDPAVAAAAAASAAAPTAPTAATVPTTPADMQTQLAAALLQMSAQNTNMMTMLGNMGAAQAQTPAPSTRTALSRSVDTKGMLKCETFSGDREKFLPWKRQFYTNMELIEASWTLLCKKVEGDLDTKMKMSDMNADEQEVARGVYALLMNLRKEDAETRVHSVEEGNGLEAWRVLCRLRRLVCRR